MSDAMDHYERKLINFALSVLDALEEHTEWDSETLGCIEEAAVIYELAESDENGMFKKREITE